MRFSGPACRVSAGKVTPVAPEDARLMGIGTSASCIDLLLQMSTSLLTFQFLNFWTSELQNFLISIVQISQFLNFSISEVLDFLAKCSCLVFEFMMLHVSLSLPFYQFMNCCNSEFLNFNYRIWGMFICFRIYDFLSFHSWNFNSKFIHKFIMLQVLTSLPNLKLLNSWNLGFHNF